MLTVISRPPNDLFTFSLVTELISKIKTEYEAYYIWTSPPEKFKHFFENTAFTKPFVILVIKDLLDLYMPFNYWNDTIQAGSQLIIEMTSKYPTTTFVIFTSNENLDKELVSPNIHIIPLGGDITNQFIEYPKITPVIDKNFDSTNTFISLNRHHRPHRILLLSYLYGNNYNQFGNCTLLTNTHSLNNELLNMISWEFDDRHTIEKEKFILGYRKIYYDLNLSTEDYQIYKYDNNDNVINFEQKLRSKYVNSFVEFITESSFEAPAFMLTEKTLNSIYGCNFPIFLGGIGIVAHLRDLGLDVFDDIVDHSYDQIINPIDRIIAAVEYNHQLLTDIIYTKEQWIKAKDRFLSNVEVAKTIYTWYATRARTCFYKLRIA